MSTFRPYYRTRQGAWYKFLTTACGFKPAEALAYIYRIEHANDNRAR